MSLTHGSREPEFFVLTHLFDVVLDAFELVDLPSNFPTYLESFLILLELSAEATVS